MIPYQIGEAGDAASLLCAVCAPAVFAAWRLVRVLWARDYLRQAGAGGKQLENSFKTVAK